MFDFNRRLTAMAVLALVVVCTAAVPRARPGAQGNSGKHVPTDSLRIVEDQTVLAVVVRTSGIASPLAPGHLIHATRYEAALVLDPERPEKATFEARVSAPDLVVNDPELQEQLQGRLLELGLLDDSLQTMSEEARENVELSMLTDYQLDAEDHPWILLETVDIRFEDDEEFPWTVRGALTVRGTRVEAPLRARMEREGSQIRIEGFGSFRFTDLGIDPYTAFLGAVRNRDEFHLYFDLTAEPQGVAAAGGEP